MNSLSLIAEHIIIGSGAHVFDVAANRLQVARGAAVGSATRTATLPLHPDFCPGPATPLDCVATTTVIRPRHDRAAGVAPLLGGRSTV